MKDAVGARSDRSSTCDCDGMRVSTRPAGNSTAGKGEAEGVGVGDREGLVEAEGDTEGVVEGEGVEVGVAEGEEEGEGEGEGMTMSTTREGRK